MPRQSMGSETRWVYDIGNAPKHGALVIPAEILLFFRDGNFMITDANP